MNKIGKWCLSVLLAVTMVMPVWAAQPADQAVYTQISASETDNVGQTEETGGLSAGETGTEETGDFVVNEKEKTVNLTEAGVRKVEQFFHIDNLADAENLSLIHI